MKNPRIFRFLALSAALFGVCPAQNAPDLLSSENAGPNLVSNPAFNDLGENQQPENWIFNHWGGNADLQARSVVKEGRDGQPCLKMASDAPTDIGFVSFPIKVKPHTAYRFGGWIKTLDLEPSSPAAKGAVITVLPMRAHSEAASGTRDWKNVYSTFNTGAETEVRLALCLGGMGQAKGTVWYEGIVLREMGAIGESGAPPPPPYRRPSLEDPLFNREGLTLDKDQTLELAELLASVVVNHAARQPVSDNTFRAHALGLALRLDPANRTAVVANGLLGGGQNLHPSSPGADFSRDWQLLDAVVRWMHGREATPDDHVLALYLGDLTRRMQPGAGFGPEYVKLHEGKESPDWSPVLPPLEKVTPPALPGSSDHTEPPPALPEHPTREVAITPGSTSPPKPPGDKIKISPHLPMEFASMPTLVQTGGAESPAALRRVNLQWNEWGFNIVKLNNGKTTREKIFPKNDGPTELKFQGEWWQLRDNWANRAKPALRKRYDAWPQRGVVDVSIPYYTANSGSSALLPLAICFEAMARGLALDPKVAAVGAFTETGEPGSHSHLPGIVLGLCRGWCDVLLVGGGTMEKLKPLAEDYGLVAPFLDTQIIEVANMDDAMAVATGKSPPDIAKAIADFKTIQLVRLRMDATQMVQNRFVADKIRAVAGTSSRHLSAALLQLAMEHQDPMDLPTSMAVYIRLYNLIEHLVLEDMEWVTQEEGQQTLALFNERMRELKPRMDRRVDSFNIKVDDALRAVADCLRLNDRTTATALRRIDGVQQQVKSFRKALDLAAAAAGH